MENKYRLLDVLGSTNGDYQAQLWTYLSGQFHKHIINRVTVYIGNVNIANRYQQDMKTPLSYTDTTVSLNTNYPFVNGKPYAYSQTAGCEGHYVELFRSSSEDDGDLIMAEINLLRLYKILPKGNYSRFGRRGMKLHFYPKCKKPIELNIQNLPFGTVTINNCIAKVSPKSFDYFRVCIGFSPYVTTLDSKTITEAFEEEVTFDVTVVVKMTLMYGNVVDYTN